MANDFLLLCLFCVSKKKGAQKVKRTIKYQLVVQDKTRAEKIGCHSDPFRGQTCEYRYGTTAKMIQEQATIDIPPNSKYGDKLSFRSIKNKIDVQLRLDKPKSSYSHFRGEL